MFLIRMHAQNLKLFHETLLLHATVTSMSPFSLLGTRDHPRMEQYREGFINVVVNAKTSMCPTYLYTVSCSSCSEFMSS